MKKLSDADMDGLRWTRTGEPHSYQLKSGADPIATLHWEKPVETQAKAEAEGASWHLKRSGFLSPVVTARDEETGKDIALLHVHLGTSLLRVAGGSTYRWNRTGFWVPAWEFKDPTGKEVVDFEPVREEARLEGGLVTVGPAGRADPNLLLLLVLGWYFIVQAWIEDEAVAASHAILDTASRAVLDPG
jgi:hypothetical protein